MLRERAEGLDNPLVIWLDDTGGGDSGLWVEGTRPPNEEDIVRLRSAREHALREDERSLRELKQRHPEWFDAASSET